MVSVGSSLFEISGLWFQLFAILPLAILSKISLLVASLFMCVVSGVDGMDSIRRMVLDAIERIVNPSDSRARNKKTTKKGKRIGKSGKRAGGGKNGGADDEDDDGPFFTDPSILPTRFKHTCNGDVELQLRKYERHVNFKNEVNFETILCRACPNLSLIHI